MIATQPATDSIAITHTFDGIEEAAHRIIEQLVSMASAMRGATWAILKPNQDLPTLSALLRGLPENAISVKGYSGARRLS